MDVFKCPKDINYSLNLSRFMNKIKKVSWKENFYIYNLIKTCI
jgi:hypothetical protein